METPLAPIEVFCSFAETDARLFEQLEHQLSVLRHERFISIWHKRQIVAGSDWQVEVNRYLDTASLILLLISPDFLASDYQYGVELQRAMRRHDNNEARVIPILLRPCDWKGAPFEKLQAIPRNGTPLTLWRNRDEGFAEVVREIRMALQVQPSQPLNLLNSTHISRRVLGRHPSLGRSPVGRDSLLLCIKQELKNSHVSSPFVVIHGQAGVGKTAIAAHLASDQEIHASFPGGVLWADLGREPSLDNIVAIWASQLYADLSRATTVSEKIACVQEKLGRIPFLLILDDLWELDPTLDPLLCMAGPGCASLVTTRNRKVATRFGHKTILVDELDEEAALTLLMSHCHGKLADREALISLAKTTGGLPLTLELMGAYINSQLPIALDPLHVQQELRQIENHLHLPGNMSPRRLSLQEAIDLSIKNLPDRQTKQAFFALGAFAPKPATFSREALQFVTGVDREVLQILYDRHLLHLVSEEQNNGEQHQSPHERYTLHQSLASAAQAHLRPKASAWTQHYIYYQKQIEQTVLIGQRGRDTQARIDWRTLFLDLPQIRAIHHPQHPASIFSIVVNRLSSSLSWLRWLNALPRWLKGMFSHLLLVWLALLRKGMRLTKQKHMEALLANYQGWLAAESGNRVHALKHYRRAQELWTILDYRPGLAQVLDNLGKTYYMQAEYQHALKAYHQALVLRRALRDRFGQAQTLTNLGPTLDMIGRINGAIKSYHAALSLYQELQDDRGEAFTLLHLGLAYHGLGQQEKTLSCLKQALIKHTNARNDVGRARTLTALGWAYLDCDFDIEQEEKLASFERAMGYFQHALELQMTFGDLAWQGSTLSRIGQVYAKQGKMAQALETYLQALTFHQSVNHHAGLSATLGLISNLFHEAGQDIWAQSIANAARSEQGHYAHLAAIFKYPLTPEYESEK